MLQHHNPNPTPPARVVVLGASGFIGKNLLHHLAGSGTEVLPITSKDIDLSQPESVKALQELIRRQDAVVIISAITPDKGKDIRTLMTNLKMGEYLSAMLEQTLCSHVVYISSDAVYADDVYLVQETSCCNPSTFHGLMHLARERMLAYALQKSKSPLACLRPCAVYGGGDTHNSYGPNRFLRTAKKERRIVLFGKGEEKRDHIYIADLCRLIELCLNHRSEGILNTVTGNSVSFSDLAQAIVNLLADEIQVEFLPRQAPITHRHFDLTTMLKVFPSFHATPLAVGLSEILKNMD